MINPSYPNCNIGTGMARCENQEITEDKCKICPAYIWEQKNV